MYVFRKSFVGLLLVALAVTACSQAPAPESAGQPEVLTPQFGTPGSDIGDAVFTSRQSGAVYSIGGSTRAVSDTENRVHTDAFLRRYNPDGTLAWQKTFNATTYEGLTDLAEDAQGNIIVSLVKIGGSGEGTELFKYTSAGRELWRRPLAGVRIAFSVDVVPTGGFFVVGDDSNFRYVIHKYDRNGTLRWAKRFSETQFFSPSASTDCAGNLYVVDFDATIYKFDPTGKLVWTRTVPAGTADGLRIYDIAIVRDSLLLLGAKIWVVKDTETEYEDETDVLIASYNLNGTQNWQRTFGTKNGDSGRSIAVDTERNLYATAYLSSDTSPTGTSFVVRKYTLAGQFLKQTTTAKNLNRPGDVVNDVAVYRNDEVYFTGQTTHDLGAGYAGGYSDAFLMRVNGQGNQVWVR